VVNQSPIRANEYRRSGKETSEKEHLVAPRQTLLWVARGMGNSDARFGGGRMEQGPQGYLASRLPYSSGPRWRGLSPLTGKALAQMAARSIKRSQGFV
jgi:hypothetical protein